MCASSIVFCAYINDFSSIFSEANDEASSGSSGDESMHMEPLQGSGHTGKLVHNTCTKSCRAKISQ